ncbi:MAG: glycosyltransferase [Blastocatellia bacterium]
MRRKLYKRFDRLREVLREGGLTALKFHLIAKAVKVRERIKYQRWIRKHDLNAKTKDDLLRCIESFQYRPLISILLPVYDVDEKWLRMCIESVLGQNYPYWELCIADDASKKLHVRQVIEEYAISDKRVKTVFRAENGHISAASNSALELATGEFTVLLDHDDELSLEALFWVVNELNEFPDAKMIYSDEDLIDEKGKRSEPKFKPDFSLDLMYSLNLVTHLSAYNTSLLKSIGGFRLGFEGSQDYDLALRVIERVSEQQIRHIPRILYHWRAIPGSVALDSDEKPYAHERARAAIREHLERCGSNAVVERTHFNLHRVRYALPTVRPSLSLIVFGHSDEVTENLMTKWPDSIDYGVIEIIFAEKSESLANSLNSAAYHSSGDILCFVDAKLIPLSTDWLDELVSFAIQPKIGAVGGKVIDSLGRVIAGGIVLGGGRLCSVAHEGVLTEEAGNMYRNRLNGNYSAVYATCFALRRKMFFEQNGFDARRYKNCFFDADLCLRLNEQGYRIVFNPNVRLKLPAGSSLTNCLNPTDEERSNLLSRWQNKIDKDPFYNPNLSKHYGRFLINI